VFFFQAEDGIRDWSVTGVQTCALPICVDPRRFFPRDLGTCRAALGLPPPPHKLLLLVGRIEPLKGIDALIRAVALLFERRPDWRSEERRVGKECRSRWWPEHDRDGRGV